MAEYHGIVININELIKDNQTCQATYRALFNIILNDYERRAIIKQQQDDMAEREMFSDLNFVDEESVKTYEHGELRWLARDEMERHLRFIPTDVVCVDSKAKLAAELER